MSIERGRSVKRGLLLALLSPLTVLNVAATEPAAELPLQPAYIQEAVWTEIGKGYQRFDQPCAVAVDYRRDVYIADCVLRAIFKFDPTGVLKDVWTHAGKHRFFYPADIVIDVDKVYVLDRYERRVYLMTLAGEHTATWHLRTAAAGNVGEATGICVDPLGGKVYIADLVKDRILSYNSAGKFLKEFGKDLQGPAKLFGPTDIVCEDDGKFVVASLNDYLVEFDPDGNVVGILGGTGDQPGQFKDPSGLAIDTQGRLYVADSGNKRLQRITRQKGTAVTTNKTPDGESKKSKKNDKGKKGKDELPMQVSEIVVWGSDTEDAVELKKPTGIAVTPDGLVIVTDPAKGTVTLWKPESPFALPKL